MTLWMDEFAHIKCRADFFRALDDAIAMTTALRRSAANAHLDAILTQLEAVRAWTAEGREPTEDERRSLTIGQLLVRELEPAQTDELDEWIKIVREVAGYFEEWLDDATFQSIDVDEMDDF